MIVQVIGKNLGTTVAKIDLNERDLKEWAEEKTYIIYSPTVEKYMYIDLQHGQVNEYEYELIWVADPVKASILNDENIDRLLEVYRLVLHYGTVVEGNWYNFVAHALLKEVESKRIEGLGELMLVPETDLDTFFNWVDAEKLFVGLK